MACRQPGGRPLSEPMMVSLLTHICVTRPQRLYIWLENASNVYAFTLIVATLADGNY